MPGPKPPAVSPAAAAGRAQRDYSPADRLLMRLHQGLEGLAARPRGPSTAAYPAGKLPEVRLDPAARRHVAGLMRVNHAGEVSAQALYHGQALVSRDPAIRQHLLHAAEEERAHLHWCETRLAELGEKPSRLSPFWYVGSFAIGAAAGLAGDRWNLGFVEETERQVVEHLEEHLQQLPREDQRSRAIVEAMKQDEERHGEQAAAAGAQVLPPPVKALMQRVAKVMKFGAYRV